MLSTLEKLEILSDAAKYDVSCSSSGSKRGGQAGKLGSALPAGCCHTWTEDGRCVSLLKVLMSNACCYHCVYCVNRCSNDVPRATFSPRELADLTMEFYRRNYIEGLFLSSAVVKNPDYTMEQMVQVLKILRREYGFRGYIHAKVIPSGDPELVEEIGCLADRISVNMEFATPRSLALLAGEKSHKKILEPIHLIQQRTVQSGQELVRYRHAGVFAPAGQTTQVIIGATPERDELLLRMSEGLYRKFGLKRVYYSAYIPIVSDVNLPAVTTAPPLRREHRLYQADWLLRFYGFESREILDEEHPDLDLEVDPKVSYALRHPELYPVEVNRADYQMLLRVPGIGVVSARRIVEARRYASLDELSLKRIGVVLRRARYFITVKGKFLGECLPDNPYLREVLKDRENFSQTSLYDSPAVSGFSRAGTVSGFLPE